MHCFGSLSFSQKVIRWEHLVICLHCCYWCFCCRSYSSTSLDVDTVSFLSLLSDLVDVFCVKDTQHLNTVLFYFTSLTECSACLELQLLLWFVYKLSFVFTLLIQLLIFSIMSSSLYSPHSTFIFWILTSVSLDTLCSLAGISVLFSFFHSSAYLDS